jgi:hypothetical protein
MQKLRKILPNRKKLLKDESSIFATSIDKSQNLKGILRISTSNMVKKVISYQFTDNFFQSAPF